MMHTPLTWTDVLGHEKTEPYFKSILQFIAQEKAAGKTIYPPQNDLFRVFQETAYDEVKVVILGQDPYHGPGQAHGLSFSVKPHVKLPPSLKNIFQELKNDLNIPISEQGCLEKWAHQGVFLLNTSLSVEAAKPLSHAKIGWSIFTDQVIKQLNNHTKPLVFLLWGAHAKSKASFINREKHLVLTAAHPSPLSAHQGFIGCKHFSKANAYLISQGREPIEWDLVGRIGFEPMTQRLKASCSTT
jgi:uracil-DNA glycosylase